MGAAVAGVGTCAASMCGGCLAAGCCKLATAGEVDTNKGARCILLWLQVVAVLTGVLMTGNPQAWLDWPCEHIPLLNSPLGICECKGLADETSCYGNQLIYRSESAAVIVFLLLLILCVSGCARQAAKDCPFGKYLGLLLITIVLLFVPNEWLTVFGQISGVVSAAYLLAQTVLFMDFAYGWNENWFTNATNSQRQGDVQGQRFWTYTIVGVSAAFLILAIVELILICTNFSGGAALSLVIITFIVSLVWFGVSITDWCEHGNILTSSVVLAYMMWLCYEALSMLPVASGGSSSLLPRWVGLVVVGASLALFATSSSKGLEKATDPVTPGQTQEALAEQGLAVGSSARQVGVDDDDTPADLDTKDFTVQCAVHACAAVYITSALAPARGDWTYTARVIAVVLSLVLYGWTLVAPKLLKGREF